MKNTASEKITVLVFGNALVGCDSIALNVAKLLEKRMSNVEFIECDAAENIERFGQNPIILDAAAGIDKVALITDLRVLQQVHPYSLHDFDLGLMLAILKKIGKIKTVRIIAIPADYDKKRAVEETKQIIEQLM